ncbi:MAG: peptidoglycan endopeptidase [Chthoniobacteraceae bacterium]
MKRLAFLLAALFLAGCAGPAPYVYRYVPGKTATLRDGYAIAPPEAPEPVQTAIAAGNRIAGLPYAWGGGHARSIDSGYDCSGSASYLLQAAGRLNSAMPSKAFRRYGESGPGEWISIYARRDHVFLVVAGLRFDTGWVKGTRGPQWSTKSRPTKGAALRHPRGL